MGLTVFALADFGCTELGQLLSFQPETFATVWLPSGLLLAVLVSTKLNSWPGVLGASFVANLISDVAFHDRFLLTGLGFWVGNAVEACVGAGLLKRYVETPFRCSSPHQVLALTAFGAFLSPTISATVSMATLSLFGGAPFSWSLWSVWWAADALGILLIVPLLLTERDAHWPLSGFGRHLRFAELGFGFLSMLLMADMSFRAVTPPGHAIWRLPYSYTVPFLLWAGVRFGQRSSAILALLFSLLVAWHTTRGSGPFVWLTTTTDERVHLFHIFLISVILTSLLLSSAVAGLKRSQELLRASDTAYRALAALQQAILDSANHTIISTDPDGTIRTFNSAAQRSLGYRSDEVVGLATPALIHDAAEIAARAESLSRELCTKVEPGFEAFVVKASMGEIDEHEWSYVCKNGRRFPVRLSITALRDGDRRITGFLGIGSDITHERLAREQLSRAAQQLEAHVAELACAKEAAEAAARAKGEFLANVSHEIRTPMNAILGMTNLTLDTPLNPIQRENLEIVKSATDSLLLLIEDLLDFSRIEAGRIQLDPAPFDVRELIEGTLDLLAIRAHGKGLEIALSVRPDVPDLVVGDSSRLRQILINLAGNAIKFTEKGQVVVEVELLSHAGDEVELQFNVRDSGIGIPEEKKDAIFRPFVQADGSTTRLYGGTGLGLAISAQLVELMGGRIWVDSHLGQGSTFHFTTRCAHALGERRPRTTTVESLRGVRALVVDDTQVNRRILGETLTNWGIDVVLAGGALEALVAFSDARRASAPFSFIILDVQMPDMDGFSLAERIRDDPASSGVVIMMLSSTDRSSMAERCKEIGISTYLHKPVRESDLLNLLLRIVSPPIATEPPIEDPRSASRPESHQSLQILVAEDNLHNQKVIGHILAREGHTATIVNNGREAVESWRRQPFDLILMDVQMPYMDGFQATAAIRAAEARTGRHVAIIAMTAYARDEDRNRCLASGMDSYVSKPVKVENLRAAIESLLVPSNPLSGEIPTNQDFEDVWNQDIALERVDGDMPFLRHMASSLLKQLPGWMAEIRAAVSAADHSQISAPAHTLKNWLGNFVAMRAMELTQQLEELVEQSDAPGSRTTLEALEGEIQRLTQAIDRFVTEQETISVPPLTRYASIPEGISCTP